MAKTLADGLEALAPKLGKDRESAMALAAKVRGQGENLTHGWLAENLQAVPPDFGGYQRILAEVMVQQVVDVV